MITKYNNDNKQLLEEFIKLIIFLSNLKDKSLASIYQILNQNEVIKINYFMMFFFPLNLVMKDIYLIPNRLHLSPVLLLIRMEVILQWELGINDGFICWIFYSPFLLTIQFTVLIESFIYQISTLFPLFMTELQNIYELIQNKHFI